MGGHSLPFSVSEPTVFSYVDDPSVRATKVHSLSPSPRRDASGLEGEPVLRGGKFSEAPLLARGLSFDSLALVKAGLWTIGDSPNPSSLHLAVVLQQAAPPLLA
jgi:hypothetical protein